VWHFKPSSVSRRTTIVVGFYRTWVIDGVLEHSPAEYVRRPAVPAESPTLGLTHLQLEALLPAGRESPNINDFAVVCLLGLLGLRIFGATGANLDDLGAEHGHRVLKVRGKGGKVVLVPLPPAVARAVDRAAAGRAAGPLVTALSPSIGYDKASAIAHKANDEGTSLREAALALGVPAADFDRIVDPTTLVGHSHRDLGLD
jgi:integrase/recombinase XerD